MNTEELQVSVIRDVDPRSPEAQEIHTIIGEALQVEQSIEDTLRQVDLIEGNSIIVAGRIGGRLATMNIFMPQRFVSDGKEALGYQSGFSATGNDYRGKGLWPRLLTASEDVLATEGAQFIFGFPNPVSHPLFIKKLNYTTIQMIKAYVPVASTFLLGGRKGADHITPDVAQTLEWKERDKGNELFTYESGKQIGFGLFRSKYGLKFLEIGAFDPGDATIGECLGNMCKAAKVSMCTVETTEDSQFLPAPAFKRYSRPFIYKPIGGKFVERPFDGFSGLADVF